MYHKYKYRMFLAMKRASFLLMQNTLGEGSNYMWRNVRLTMRFRGIPSLNCDIHHSNSEAGKKSLSVTRSRRILLRIFMGLLNGVLIAWPRRLS